MVFIFRKSQSAIPRNDGFAAPDIDLVVGPAVDRYAVTDGFVVGYVREVDTRVPYSEHSEPGWFLIDRGTGDVQAGLSAVEWEQQLSDRGVDASGVDLRSAD